MITKFNYLIYLIQLLNTFQNITKHDARSHVPEMYITINSN